MEIVFVEKPSEVLDLFQKRIEEIADEFRSMGGTFVCAMAIQDDLENTERWVTVIRPINFSSRGLSDELHNVLCDMTSGYEGEPEPE